MNARHLEPSRRELLSLSIGAGLLLLVSGRLRAASTPTGVLDAREREVLARLGEAVLDIEVDDARALAERLDRALLGFEPALQRKVAAALRAMDSATLSLIFDGRAERLRPRTRAEVLARVQRWADARLGARQQIVVALRAMLVAAWWGSPASYLACGYPGPPDFGQRSAPPPPGREGP